MEKGGICWGFIGLLPALGLVLVLVGLLWWLWKRHEEASEAQVIELETETPPPPVEPPVAEVMGETEAAAAAATVAVAEPPAPPEPDDLKRIEGIGPKISSVLQAAGVTTFAQLAKTEVSRLEEILEAESPRLRRLADPSTWPEQAALAASGAWEALAALQGELKGGRRV